MDSTPIKVDIHVLLSDQLANPRAGIERKDGENIETRRFFFRSLKVGEALVHRLPIVEDLSLFFPHDHVADGIVWDQALAFGIVIEFVQSRANPVAGARGQALFGHKAVQVCF